MANKIELIDLLTRLYDYMENRADADGSSEGYVANKEMSLMGEIGDMLHALGEKGFGNETRASLDSNYKFGNFSLNENSKNNRNKKSIRLTESDLIRIIKKVIIEQPEKDDVLLRWLENTTVMPYIAPNPYSGGVLKLGIQIKGNDGNTLELYDIKGNQKFSTLINLIERLDITTENGKSVYTTDKEFRGETEIINNSYVHYGLFGPDSDLMRNLDKFTNKTNKFIVTVTPRLSDDLLKTGSKLFKTKPNILMVN